MKSNKTLIAAAVVGILIIAVQTAPLLLTAGCGKEPAPAPAKTTPVGKTTTKEPKESCAVVINCDGVKKVPSGKYRYFFHVYNEGDKNFSGEVAIVFVSANGSRMPAITDKISDTIEPKTGGFIYIDDYVGPPCVHGSEGYASFKYKAGGRGYTPKSGTGSIPNDYEIFY